MAAPNPHVTEFAAEVIHCMSWCTIVVLVVFCILMSPILLLANLWEWVSDRRNSETL